MVWGPGYDVLCGVVLQMLSELCWLDSVARFHVQAYEVELRFTYDSSVWGELVKELTLREMEKVLGFNYIN